jgi:hypothetical protein
MSGKKVMAVNNIEANGFVFGVSMYIYIWLHLIAFGVV